MQCTCADFEILATAGVFESDTFWSPAVWPSLRFTTHSSSMEYKLLYVVFTRQLSKYGHKSKCLLSAYWKLAAAHCEPRASPGSLIWWSKTPPSTRSCSSTLMLTLFDHENRVAHCMFFHETVQINHPPLHSSCLPLVTMLQIQFLSSGQRCSHISQSQLSESSWLSFLLL